MATRLLNTQRIVNLSSNPASASAGEIYYNTSENKLKVYNGSSWGDLGGGSGTVTSVGVSVPTGLSVANSPITTSGTVAISLASGYTIPTTAALDAKAPLASPTFTGTVTAGAIYASPVIVGNTSGNVGLSINDGYGNANLFFNHYAGTPDVTGNSGRIVVNVDATTNASMQFQLKSTTTSGVAVSLTNVFTLYETYASFVGGVITSASTTSMPSLRIPHGTAPTSPTNGDIWTTTTGLFARINGATVGPYGIGTARTFYQTAAPSTPTAGDIWVDSDETYVAINSNDYVLKSEIDNYVFNSFFLSGLIS